jgi:hypothetical protein
LPPGLVADGLYRADHPRVAGWQEAHQRQQQAGVELGGAWARVKHPRSGSTARWQISACTWVRSFCPTHRAGQAEPSSSTCGVPASVWPYDHPGIVKRSATLEIQTSMLTRTERKQAAQGGPLVAVSVWPGRRSRRFEWDSARQGFQEIACGRARVHAGHFPRQAPRRYRRTVAPPAIG